MIRQQRNEIMYQVRLPIFLFLSFLLTSVTTCQAFNEELDGMFNDANLPADEAWTAMTSEPSEGQGRP